MSETQALTVRPMDDMTLGKVLVDSKFFADTSQAAQAIVKMLAGREAGFGPIASMTGIYVRQGKITWSAGLMAAAVKRSGRYNYRVREHTDQVCAIEFFEGKDSVGISTFTLKDAERANLLGNQTWKSYPRNMLFARAMSNGARFYCPDVFGGVSVYTPEELSTSAGEYTDTDTGEIVEPKRRPAHEYIDAARASMAADVALPDEPRNGNGRSIPVTTKSAGAARIAEVVAEGRNFYRCQHCHKGINGYRHAGQFVTAQEVAQKSIDTYHVQLCLECAQGVKAGTIVLETPKPTPEPEPLPAYADDDEEIADAVAN